MSKLPKSQRMRLISPSSQLSISKQCELLDIARSSYYHTPKGESWDNLILMEKIDRLHLQHPYWGRPQMTENLKKMGYWVNHKRVGRLMRLMNIRSVLPAPNTSLPNKAHEIYPYLLRGVDITHPDQVWSTDITYIAMPRGFMYLIAVMDWYSRYVLSWELSNTMDTPFCITALEDAFGYGQPIIFNTDQGSQFTSKDFTTVLKDKSIKISMDGKGRALDNVFVERLWWSVKYEHVYLFAHQNGNALFDGLQKYFDYYNNRRLHSSLDYRTPKEVYFNTLKQT